MAFRILYNPASDLAAATITSTSEAGDNADGNIVNNKVGKKWRTTSDTAEWIKWDLGSSKVVDAVALLNTNLTSAATLKFEGHATDSWGTPTMDQTITIPTDADSNVLGRMVVFPTQQTLRWYRFTLDDPTNPDSYIQAGRAMFGQYYETTRDMSDDFAVELLDPSTGDDKPGEVPVKTQKPRYRRISTSFEIVTQTEADKWAAIFEHIGNSRPALISWDQTTRVSEDAAYCFLKTPLGLAHQFLDRHSILRLVWEEKTR